MHGTMLNHDDLVKLMRLRLKNRTGLAGASAAILEYQELLKEVCPEAPVGRATPVPVVVRELPRAEPVTPAPERPRVLYPKYKPEHEYEQYEGNAVE